MERDKEGRGREEEGRRKGRVVCVSGVGGGGFRDAPLVDYTHGMGGGRGGGGGRRVKEGGKDGDVERGTEEKGEEGEDGESGRYIWK